MLANRSPGILESALATIACSPSGIPPRSIGGGGSIRICVSSDCRGMRVNGHCPASIWYMMTPSA